MLSLPGPSWYLTMVSTVSTLLYGLVICKPKFPVFSSCSPIGLSSVLWSLFISHIHFKIRLSAEAISSFIAFEFGSLLPCFSVNYSLVRFTSLFFCLPCSLVCERFLVIGPGLCFWYSTWHRIVPLSELAGWATRLRVEEQASLTGP